MTNKKQKGNQIKQLPMLKLDDERTKVSKEKLPPTGHNKLIKAKNLLFTGNSHKNDYKSEFIQI